MLSANERKRSNIGYFCTMAGSSGYYGYYLKNTESLLVWLVVFSIGIILLGNKNYHVFKNGRKVLVFADIVYVFIICLMPSMLDWPAGLNIVAMIFTGSLYSYVMNRYIIQ